MLLFFSIVHELPEYWKADFLSSFLIHAVNICSRLLILLLEKMRKAERFQNIWSILTAGIEGKDQYMRFQFFYFFYIILQKKASHRISNVAGLFLL